MWRLAEGGSADQFNNKHNKRKNHTNPYEKSTVVIPWYIESRVNEKEDRQKKSKLHTLKKLSNDWLLRLPNKNSQINVKYHK